MFGAILGDIVGSVYEFNNCKTDNIETISLAQPACHYTDDSVLTLAVAEAILTDGDYQGALHRWGQNYASAGYGARFCHWLQSDSPQPYNSWGNGSAMRVSPIGWAFDALETVLHEAQRSAEPTHNHPEGIKGAQATAATIWLARFGHSKEEIQSFVTESFAYNLSQTVAEIRPSYTFNESCQGTVPQAITIFLESHNYEHALKLAISIGGDSDTIACIVGGIAEAFYDEIPQELSLFGLSKLPHPMQEILYQFTKTYPLRKSPRKKSSRRKSPCL